MPNCCCGCTNINTNTNTSTSPTEQPQYNLAVLHGKISGVAAVIVKKPISDNATITVDDDFKVSLHGFYDAPDFAVPCKGKDGTLHWEFSGMRVGDFAKWLTDLETRLSVDEDGITALENANEQFNNMLVALGQRVAYLETVCSETQNPLVHRIDAIETKMDAVMATNTTALLAQATANNAMSTALDAKQSVLTSADRAERAADAAQEAWQAVKRMEGAYTSVQYFDTDADLPDRGVEPCIYIVGDKLLVWDETEGCYKMPEADVTIGTINCGTSQE